VIAVETEGLGKRYNKSTWGLRDCTLQLPAGAIVALVGPNGAGKTTLLQAVTGLLTPTEGVVRVFGEPMRSDNTQALAQVGFVAQHHPLYKNFTVADLLRMGRRLNLRWDQAFTENRLAGLGIPLNRRARELSGGQQAQVALALALAKRAPLLVLDEPLADLDPIARRDFLRVLMADAADGPAVLMSSHVIAELERVCDWLVVLAEGRVRLAGPIDDIVASHQLLTGPRDAWDPRMPGLVHAAHSDRHTSMLVRQSGHRPATHPSWQSRPVGLEELVLAYLERAAEPQLQEAVSR
jgi:ABC-2 type transport system ATP-binding protein